LTVGVIVDITFVRHEPAREIGRGGIFVVAFDGFAHVSDFQHLFSPRINYWLFFIDEFFRNSICKNNKTSFQRNNIFVVLALDELRQKG
jgi:hypothetical protein